jgi:hypothetical protein
LAGDWTRRSARTFGDCPGPRPALDGCVIDGAIPHSRFYPGSLWFESTPGTLYHEDSIPIAGK